MHTTKAGASPHGDKHFGLLADLFEPSYFVLPGYTALYKSDVIIILFV